MGIKVLVFGQIAEVLGNPEMEMKEVYDTNELRHKVTALFPEMAGIRYTIAVNRKTIHENTGLSDGDIVALLPPFSGG